MAVVTPKVPVLMTLIGDIEMQDVFYAYVRKCKWVNSSNQPISDPGQVTSYLQALSDTTRLGPFSYQDKDGNDNAPIGTWHYLYDDENTQFGSVTDLTGETSDLHRIT